MLQKLTARFFRNPRAFTGDIWTRLRRLRPPVSINSTWEVVLKKLAGMKTVVLYGELDGKEKLEAAGFTVVSWISDRFRDQEKGAISSATYLSQKQALPDAFVACGIDLPIKYLFFIRQLDKQNEVRPILWVGGPFEFAGSTLPIPKEIESASFHLFNHFSDFFGIKEPLLVQVRAKTAGQPPVDQIHLVRPRQTLTIHLNEILPNRTEAASIEFLCIHPQLTRGRHTRWRIWADLFYQGSISSLHGAHDYGPSHWNESRLHLPELMPGQLTVTFPNYGGRLTRSERSLRWGSEGRWQRDHRSATLPVEQRNWNVLETRRDFAHYNFFGHGDCFWFNFKPQNSASVGALMSNHQVTVENSDLRAPISPVLRNKMSAIVERGFLLHPHYVPLNPETEPLQWGFSFAPASPRVNDFILVFVDAEGNVLEKRPWHLEETGIVWGEQLKKFAPAKATGVLVAPDWNKLNLDPTRINFFGHLFVREKASGDVDATEFQNSWRNNGVQIEELPHWIHPSKAVNSRTHVLGRVLENSTAETVLLLSFASGNLNLRKSAKVKVEVYKQNGEAIAQEVMIDSFTHKEIAFKKLFPNIMEFLAGNAGSCRITSGDADLNASIVTRLQTGGISLQHLWGY